jgi:Transposase zinc-binding domain
MGRPVLEVADIFRDHGPAWRKANAGHVILGQLKVMAAIESCRTAALGGHVARCEDCAHEVIAYNSCRNRHCPKCQGAAAVRVRGGFVICGRPRLARVFMSGLCNTVGCSHMSGLSARLVWPLALMISAD